MADGTSNGDSLTATGPGGTSITARGGVVVILVIAALLGGLMFYFAQNSEAQHRGVVTALRQQTCVLSLTPEERVQLRADLRRNMGQATTVLATWCPWILMPNGESAN